ncbi:acylsugar acyltransferase 3-like [Solanum pennellii]|uniref:Acylsugar acyltransferase 3-like n=1 Tax=Solanum pennellii TaxID=28526 RepID=A0ABM1H820_SOLPN|nr:acylsugar acyltransferase 3-like [Solanum pennellii]
MGSISRIVSMTKRMIKPSSPTLPSLKRHNLSLLDCNANNEYLPIVFFYPKPTVPVNNISQILQQSFSKALKYYYPFAGVLKDNTYVDCNDRGAEFLNVRVDCRMSDVINSCDDSRSGEKYVFPQGLAYGKSNFFDGRLVMAQLTHFDCGGIAVSFCFSHKIADGYSSCNFMNDWAAIARDPNSAKPSPRFDGASFFPPIRNAGTSDVNNLPQEGAVQQRYVTRRYLFSASKLNTLKAKIVDSGSGIVRNPSRVESVSALLYKSAAANRNNTSFRPSTFTLFANIRPPLPLNTIGNAPGYISTSIEEEVDMQLHRIVAEIRKGKEKLRNRFNTVDTNKLVFESFELMKEVGQVFNKEGFDIYRCSSLCNFPFYNVDFGWGRPNRVSLLIPPCNIICLLDSQNLDGGVEAIVTLQESDMTFFQQDKQLLQFATPI